MDSDISLDIDFIHGPSCKNAEFQTQNEWNGFEPEQYSQLWHVPFIGKYFFILSLKNLSHNLFLYSSAQPPSGGLRQLSACRWHQGNLQDHVIGADGVWVVP